MNTINVITNNIYYDVFIGEKFNNNDPDLPVRSSRWYEYRNKRDGKPPAKDKTLPSSTISIFKGIKKIDFDLYIADRKFWILSKKLYAFFKQKNILDIDLFEYSQHSIYDFKGTLLNDDFVMLRFFEDNSSIIDWQNVETINVKDQFTGVKNSYYSKLSFLKHLDMFVLHKSPFYSRAFFTSDTLKRELIENFKGLESFSLNEFINYHRAKYRY
ncbi:hypothetical protein Q4599_17085 [Cellulophaga lytica]|uniref:Imm43 family immunity protein n=1 Tax=Cellulophaga lytica TaxID=979 RepID=UPI0026E3F5A5|nr:hypothetical protein [Cellulophaga lytica]MDO6855301.1 hypothetical protein [Cellulophaga lytica]